MAYKDTKTVVEDMIVGESCSGGRRIFTGGQSVLQLPFTISFMCKGDFTVHIDSGQVVVHKVEKPTITIADKEEAKAISDAFRSFP